MKIRNKANLKNDEIVVIKKDKKVYHENVAIQEHDLDIFKRRDFYYGIVKGEYIYPVLYADLHRHSSYSLLDGAIKVGDMAEKTELFGAITDHGNMFGFLNFYKEMKKRNKKPILGCEVYVETVFGEKKTNHLVLLVKNKKGYENLIKLVSKAYDNFYKKPHVSFEDLKKHSEGLICTSACIGGEIPEALLQGDDEKAKNVANAYKKIFKDDFYIEIQRHNFLQEKEIEVKLVKLARELGIKIIATTDAHYLNKEDKESHEILLCLQQKTNLEDDNRWQFPGEDYYIHTSEEMYEKFKDIPESLDNTLEIAEKVNFEIETQILLPKFEVPQGYTEEEYFEYLCKKGFKERIKNPTREYIDRFNYELEIIKKTGYCGYFLIVQDYINWAKDNDILVGPGRGSCVGSLLAYCLKITDVDPLEYDLLFERFLNPDRISMPDIDTDFQDDKRDLVIDYIKNKYGENSVAKIVTFGTLKTKSLIKDVGRTLGVDYSFINNTTKLIPDNVKNLQVALEEVVELKDLYEQNEDIRKIINIGKNLEGLKRHNSIHACGIVITPEETEKYIPTIKIKDKDTDINERVTQLTMEEVEEMGLLKMDFLGLRTMTVIKNTLNLLRKKIDLYQIPFEYEVFEHLRKGNTLGVFQLESKGITKVIEDIYQNIDKNKHSTKELFERLIAGVSLYRPGPMDSIPEYIENMKNPSKVSYKIPELKEILDKTYGIIVYQEQVMQIVQKLAGYTLARADLVRKAMGKKKEDIMLKEKEIFINGLVDEKGNVLIKGCIRNGIKKELAEEIWDKMVEFAKYAFNKSHATAYALISYWTAYLSCHYPLEFATSLLNSYIESNEKIQYYIGQIKKKGFDILPPDINKSLSVFSIEDGKIRFGLKAIKSLGKTSEFIIEERKERGEFVSYSDFVERMICYQKIDKSSIEALIFSNALNSFEGNKKQKIEIMPQLIKIAQNMKKEKESAQLSFFELNNFTKIELPKVSEYTKDELLKFEKEYMGIYLTEHPTETYKIEGITNVVDLQLNQEAKVLVNIEEKKVFYSKKTYEPIYSLTCEDNTGEINVIVFSKEVEKYKEILEKEKVIIIEGKYEEGNFGKQMIATKISNPKIEQITNPKYIKIYTNKKLTKEEQEIMKSITLKEKKAGVVELKYYYNNKIFQYFIKYNHQNIEKLKNIYQDNISIIY